MLARNYLLLAAPAAQQAAEALAQALEADSARDEPLMPVRLRRLAEAAKALAAEVEAAQHYYAKSKITPSLTSL